MDGSSGQSEYNQSFEQGEGGDSSIFMVCVVPLKVEDSSGAIVWRNPNPSSTHLCRPVRFVFAKASDALIKREKDFMQSQIDTLTNTHVVVGDIICPVVHVLELTMIDGKLANSLSRTKSAMRCNIC